MQVNWEIYFNTLNGSINLPFVAIEETDKSVSIILPEAEARALTARLKTTLASQEAFIESFPFKMTPVHSSPSAASSSDASSASMIDEEVPNAPQTKEACYEILVNLFGEDTLEETAMAYRLSRAKDSDVKDGVLYSSPITNPDLLEATQANLKHLIAHFADIDDARLKQAWTNSNAPLPTPSKTLDSEDNPNAKLAGLVARCFIIETYPDAKDPNKTIAKIRVNVKGLYEYLFSPLIVTEELASDTEEKHIKLTFNRQHLLSRVQHLMGGPLLRLCYSQEEEQAFLKPVFAGLESEGGQKPTLYILEVDQSYSMRFSIEKVQAQVISIIEKLRVDDPHPGSKVRLVKFSTETSAEEHPLHDFNVKRWTGTLEPTASTRLFGTVDDDLRYLARTKATEHYNVVMYLITDGYDNVSHRNIGSRMEKRDIDDFIAELKLSMTLPTIIAAGINGEEGSYDVDVLASLAESLNGIFYDMQHGGDFSALASETARKLSRPSNIITFTHQVSGSISVYRIPIYENGQLQMPAISLAIGSEEHIIGIDGNQWLISVTDPSKLPEETTNEVAQRTLATAKAIVSDENESEKFAKLELALHTLMKLDEKVQHQNPTVKNALDEVRKYHELSALPADSAAKRSAISVATRERGYFQQTHRGPMYVPGPAGGPEASSSTSNATLLASVGGPLHQRPATPPQSTVAAQSTAYRR